MEMQNDRVLREPQVSDITQLSKSTRWRLEKAGLFPKKIILSQNAVGWLASEINSWIEQRTNESRGKECNQ